jgi:hypothetical protein
VAQRVYERYIQLLFLNRGPDGRPVRALLLQLARRVFRINLRQLRGRAAAALRR